MASEASTVRAIKAYLDEIGAFHFKVHGSEFQQAGLPDIIGSYQGRFFGFEVKNEKGKATKLQLCTLAEIQGAGGIAAVVRSVDDVRRQLEDVPYQ